jgi:hypothetical protein
VKEPWRHGSETIISIGEKYLGGAARKAAKSENI